jgi:hypothetical protein
MLPIVFFTDGRKRPWDRRRLRPERLLRDARLEVLLKQEWVAERIGSDQTVAINARQFVTEFTIVTVMPSLHSVLSSSR